MGNEEFVFHKVYMSESVGTDSRGRPPGRWRDRIKEYMCERGATREGGLDQAGRECLDRERWRLFCCGHTLGGHSGGSEASELRIDGYRIRNLEALMNINSFTLISMGRTAPWFTQIMVCLGRMHHRGPLDEVLDCSFKIMTISW